MCSRGHQQQASETARSQETPILLRLRVYARISVISFHVIMIMYREEEWSHTLHMHCCNCIEFSSVSEMHKYAFDIII